MDDASYITGFVDGEGSFLVSFQKRAKLATGIEVRPSFTVSQHKRNQSVLIWMQGFFGCGGIRFNRSDQTFKYEVRSLPDLLRKVIPHFERFPLKSTKQKDFERFRRICGLMKESKHLSRDGLRDIIATAYEMNNLGARRYDQASLLRIVAR